MKLVGMFSSVLVLAVVACSPFGHHGEDAPSRRQPAMVMSPNGEPLSGGAAGDVACAEAMAGCLARADTDHDGVLSQAEFMADASAQFARMDADHDGFITADELATYRSPFRPEPGPEPRNRPKADSGDDGWWGGRAGGSGRRGGGSSGSGGGFSEPVGRTAGSSPDPVMSADANLDFKVSRDEFTTQAEANFRALDLNRDGVLDQGEITRTCPASRK